MNLALRRELIKYLGLQSDQKFFLDSAMKSSRSDIKRVAQYSVTQNVEFLLPACKIQCTNCYLPRFIYEINDAFIEPRSGMVYDSHGFFIAESSSWWHTRHFYSCPRPQIKTSRRKMLGTFVFLPSNGYYHWLIEDLPPFLKAISDFPEATIVVPVDRKQFVDDFLSRLNQRVLSVDRLYQYERLILVGKTAGMGSPSMGLTPHPVDLHMLQTYFSKSRQMPCKQSKLYLSRVDDRRSPPNEKTIEHAFANAGFEIFRGQRYTLEQQVEAFSRATLIVGIHGAAFANIVWCHAGTKVLEFFDPNYMPAVYSIISSICDLEYAFEQQARLNELIEDSNAHLILQSLEVFCNAASSKR